MLRDRPESELCAVSVVLLCAVPVVLLCALYMHGYAGCSRVQGKREGN